MTSDLRARLQTTLGDSYTIERELGGGGMARVFLAIETGLSRTVVVKILAPELAAEVSAERFAREVKLAARLQQANIVPLLSAGESNGLAWYSMPYVRGESLRTRLAAGEPVSLTDAVNILRDVARALAFAHGEGVVHRDIKPENILLSGGAAVVTDFGIAKAITTSRTHDGHGPTITQMGAAIGTPAYMAPEQIAGDPGVDHRADLYAWGVVAWELIAGRHPFSSKASAQAVLAAHLTESCPSLATIRSNVPPSLASLVARCLEKDPSRRPQSAAEVLSSLDQIGSSSGSTPSMTRSSRLSARTLAIAAAVVVVLGTSAWLMARRTSASATSAGYKSLAVLPFGSREGDTANAYFAEGMADELTTELAKVGGLRLAATSSAAAYRNKAADVREVGKSLNVSAVLQGTVRREGGRIRVSAQLSDAADGLVVWTNSYEREVKDVFAVQDELTRDIVSALRVTLAGTVATGVGGGPATHDTTDFETYDVYLRGLHLLRARGTGVMSSIAYFRQALARDSSYARGWSELAEAYCVLPLYSPVPVDSTLPLGRSAIARAHALDPSDANAYAAEGFCDMLAIQPREAQVAFDRAISLDSGNAFANRARWSALESAGQTDAAVDAARRAARFDPLGATSAWVGAQVMLVAKRYDEGIAMATRSVELDSSANNPARLVHALILHALNDDSGARAVLHGSSISAPQILPWLGYLTAVTGDRSGATAFIRRRESERAHDSFRNLTVAWTYLGAGDTTRALDALERAVRAREPLPFSVPFSMPAYDPLRRSARFAAVVKAYNMDPAGFGIGTSTPK